MPPSTLGAAAAFLALLFWLLGRRRPVVVLSSTDASAVAALNRSQIAAASLPAGPEPDPAPQFAPSDDPESPEPSGVPFPAPAALRERASYLAGLHARLAGDTPSRLAAMREARQWGHREALPLLRRGLRDCDLAVVREAALGLERFRGRSTGSDVQPATSQAVTLAGLPLPRNVSRTR